MRNNASFTLHNSNLGILTHNNLWLVHLHLLFITPFHNVGFIVKNVGHVLFSDLYFPFKS